VGTYSSTPADNHVEVEESVAWTTSSEDKPQT
jgi:hypothetical protein